MFTLIAIGTGAAWAYSAVATLFPEVFPASFRGMGGGVAVYFEAAAVIVTLVLLAKCSSYAREVRRVPRSARSSVLLRRRRAE